MCDWKSDIGLHERAIEIIFTKRDCNSFLEQSDTKIIEVCSNTR